MFFFLRSSIHFVDYRNIWLVSYKLNYDSFFNVTKITLLWYLKKRQNKTNCSLALLVL